MYFLRRVCLSAAVACARCGCLLVPVCVLLLLLLCLVLLVVVVLLWLVCCVLRDS